VDRWVGWLDGTGVSDRALRNIHISRGSVRSPRLTYNKQISTDREDHATKIRRIGIRNAMFFYSAESGVPRRVVACLHLIIAWQDGLVHAIILVAGSIALLAAMTWMQRGPRVKSITILIPNNGLQRRNAQEDNDGGGGGHW
jgi:hypothetical protein